MKLSFLFQLDFCMMLYHQLLLLVQQSQLPLLAQLVRVLQCQQLVLLESHLSSQTWRHIQAVTVPVLSPTWSQGVQTQRKYYWASDLEAQWEVLVASIQKFHVYHAASCSLPRSVDMNILLTGSLFMLFPISVFYQRAKNNKNERRWILPVIILYLTVLFMKLPSSAC